MESRKYLQVCNATLLFALMLNAQHTAAGDEEFEQHKAHEHGSGALNLAVEGKQLFIELESPAANIVGFEHEARNADEKERVHKAEVLLEKGLQLFGLPDAAGCKLASADLEGALFETDHDEHHDEHEGEKHDEHKDEKHKVEEKHADHDKETHSDIHAVYKFECDKVDRLSYVDVLIFKEFPATEELNVQVVGPGGQALLELTEKSNRIKL